MLLAVLSDPTFAASPLAEAHAVRIEIDPESENADLLPFRDLLRSLLSEVGLPDGPDPDLDLVLTVTVQHLGEPRMESTPDPELRWDPPSTDYWAYRGARVQGTVDLGGRRIRFDGLTPGFDGDTSVHPPPDPVLGPVSNPYVGNALIDSRLFDRLALAIGRARGVDALLPATLDSTPIVADAALAALDRLDPRWPDRSAATAFVPALVAALVSNAPAPRRRALELLPRIDPGFLGHDAFRAEVPALIDAADAYDPWLGADTRAVLQQVADPTTAELLVPLLDHPDPKMRTLAYAALTRLRDPRVVEPLIRFASTDLGGGWSTDVGEWSPIAAVSALGELGDPRAVEPLIAILDQPFTGDAAIEALGKIGDPRAIDPLRAVLEAPDSSSFGEARAAAAATALSALSEDDAYDRIVGHLVCWSDDAELRRGMPFLDAVVTLHDPRAAAVLQHLALECHYPPAVRAAYLRALGSFDGPDVHRLLRSYARRRKYADPEVVHAARAALHARPQLGRGRHEA